MSFILTIASPRLYGAREPVKDPAYLRFLRGLPCSACGSGKWSEAAHFGPRGLGQKASDRDTLPLCHRCHRTSPLSYHQLGPVKFGLAHKIDVSALILKLNDFYDSRLTPVRSEAKLTLVPTPVSPRSTMQFTIDADNAIQAHPAGAPPDPGHVIFTTAAQLGAAIDGRKPEEVWNSFAGVIPFSELKPVSKFENRAKGIDRIWRAIQRLATVEPVTVSKAASKKPAVKTKDSKTAKAKPSPTRVEGKETKGGIIRRLIARKDGATIDELMKATGWQAHSVRGAIATMHTKHGVKVAGSKNADGIRVYQGA